MTTDAGLAILGFWLAYWLRYDLHIGGTVAEASQQPFSFFYSKMLLLAVLQVAVYVRMLRSWIGPDHDAAAAVVEGMARQRAALGLTAVDRPVPAAGRGGLVCAHCGFASAHERAFYCPKCGMRLLRG